MTRREFVRISVAVIQGDRGPYDDMTATEFKAFVEHFVAFIHESPDGADWLAKRLDAHEALKRGELREVTFTKGSA